MSLGQKIWAICLMMMVAIIGLASVSLVLNLQLGQETLDLYDKAFIGVHYAQNVQTGFARIEGRRATAPFTSERDIADVNTVIDNLDVAIDPGQSGELIIR